MTTRDPDLSYETPDQAIPYAFGRMCVDLHTALPGVVVAYDSTANRAQVQPSADILLDDGTSTPRAVVVDVPVWFPSGGGFTITWPIKDGDPVLLVYCERDISGFKQHRTAGPLPSDRMHTEADALAIAGYPPTNRPAAADAIEITSADGTTKIAVADGAIRLAASTVIVDGDLVVTGDARGSTPWQPPNP